MSMMLTKPKSAAKVRKSSRPKKLSQKLRDDDVAPAPVRQRLLEATGGVPPPPPVDLNVGKCHAMGDECGHPTLQRNRHLCVGCGDGVHAIEPCGFELEPEEGGGVACANCYSEMKPAAKNLKKNLEGIDSDSDNSSVHSVVDKADRTRHRIWFRRGPCPAMQGRCLSVQCAWGDVTCCNCLLPTHKHPTCLMVDEDSGKKYCKSCWEMEEIGLGLRLSKTQESPQRDDVNLPSLPPLPRQEDELEEQDPQDQYDNEPMTDEAAAVSEALGVAAAAAGPKRSRGKNYSNHEDYLITQAWCSVSADS